MQTMYKIGDFSQIGQISVRMLRHYDKLGLLKPGYTDEWTGYRYYTLEQLPRLHQILALRDLGLKLEQIGDLLDDPLAEERLYGLLQDKQQALEEQLAEEQARLERVAARMQLIEKAQAPIPYDIALKTLPAQRVLAVRDVVAHVSRMGESRDKMLRLLYARLDELAIRPGVEMAIYHMQGYAEDDIDMSLAVELAQDSHHPEPGEMLHAYTLPEAPLAASVVYDGSMWNIPDVVASLYRWLGMNGYTSAGAYRELHLFGRELELFAGDPSGTAVFEILVPVEKL